MVTSMERGLRQMDGDWMRPVLGTQGGDIRDKQRMEASSTRDGFMDSSYLESPSAVENLVAGHSWMLKLCWGFYLLMKFLMNFLGCHTSLPLL